MASTLKPATIPDLPPLLSSYTAQVNTPQWPEHIPRYGMSSFEHYMRLGEHIPPSVKAVFDSVGGPEAYRQMELNYQRAYDQYLIDFKNTQANLYSQYLRDSNVSPESYEENMVSAGYMSPSEQTARQETREAVAAIPTQFVSKPRIGASSPSVSVPTPSVSAAPPPPPPPPPKAVNLPMIPQNFMPSFSLDPALFGQDNPYIDPKSPYYVPPPPQYVRMFQEGGEVKAEAPRWTGYVSPTGSVYSPENVKRGLYGPQVTEAINRQYGSIANYEKAYNQYTRAYDDYSAQFERQRQAEVDAYRAANPPITPEQEAARAAAQQQKELALGIRNSAFEGLQAMRDAERQKAIADAQRDLEAIDSARRNGVITSDQHTTLRNQVIQNRESIKDEIDVNWRGYRDAASEGYSSLSTKSLAFPKSLGSTYTPVEISSSVKPTEYVPRQTEPFDVAKFQADEAMRIAQLQQEASTPSLDGRIQTNKVPTNVFAFPNTAPKSVTTRGSVNLPMIPQNFVPSFSLDPTLFGQDNPYLNPQSPYYVPPSSSSVRMFNKGGSVASDKSSLRMELESLMKAMGEEVPPEPKSDRTPSRLEADMLGYILRERAAREQGEGLGRDQLAASDLRRLGLASRGPLMVKTFSNDE
jgi:hypothetical protein